MEQQLIYGTASTCPSSAFARRSTYSCLPTAPTPAPPSNTR